VISLRLPKALSETPKVRLRCQWCSSQRSIGFVQPLWPSQECNEWCCASCRGHAATLVFPGAVAQPRRLGRSTSCMNDEEFLAAFERCALEEFHHRDHIKVAYLYLRRHPLEEATARVCAGLKALAVAWSAPVDDLEKGYHETMTQAWVRLVHLTLAKDGIAESADAFCDEQPQLMQKTRLELFYSRDRLITWAAKREFVEPDLAKFQVDQREA
jgi:hypothetical protein